MNGVDKVTLRKKISVHLEDIYSPKEIYDLFHLLNYPDNVFFDPSFKRKKEAFDFKKEDSERIENIYSVLSFGNKKEKGDKLPIFFLKTSTLNPTFLRNVTKKFSDMYLRFLLLFTVDYKEIVIVYPNFEKKEAGKHKLKITKLILKKGEIYYTDVETLANIYYGGTEDTWRDVWKKWSKAFSVERVTNNFFEDYKGLFFKLRKELDKQKISRKVAHDYTLQLLNRMMFIYFISKKGWLGRTKFMEWFWNSYLIDRNKGNTKKDTFYEIWLKQIFFKAFNNRTNKITDLPDEIKNQLLDFPYLNGGLFTEDETDEADVKIYDVLFREIFGFFEKYNFTIKEDMPLDEEVAVDPQMIGYVYESLANVAEEIYDRTDMGIFYTQRIEVHFMCGSALVEYLSKHLPKIPKEKFYHLIFDLPEEREKIENYFEKNKIWNDLEECLEELSVVDPACGSGAFLVGMLNILAEIYKMIYKHRKTSLTDFDLKTRIIGRSLYGVDVMPWAIHAAELRLWLQLIVETTFKKEELRSHPLLPNLNMNLKVGDSLVQEIGGMSLHLRDSKISDKLKKKLLYLKNEKEKYFNNEATAKFKSQEELRGEEIRIFEEIIDERIKKLKKEKNDLEEKIKKLGKTTQKNLLGKTSVEKQKKIIDEKEQKKRICDKIQSNLDELNKIIKGLEDPKKKPFIWDLDFAEVFGDKEGFDIVIGNPPYVRHEKISPPNKLKNEVTKEDRKEYKNKLSESVKKHIPVVNYISKKSDYYIYFYFHGLSLLNDKGTFCFITSNSWLDVDYGKELQEFLLKYVPIVAIYDNPKRSFAHADVNTVIILFDSPRLKRNGEWWRRANAEWGAVKETAKFIMFKKPFEEVISSTNLIKIDEVKADVKPGEITELVKNVVKTNDYRIFPISQENLLEEGWEYPEKYEPEKNGRMKRGRYNGNKWGSKYLRAPDIFYVLLEKGKFVKLINKGKLETYLNTGGADKFYFVKLIDSVSKNLSKIRNKEFNEEFDVESRFLKPIIKSSQELSKIMIKKEDVKSHMIFIGKNEKISNFKIYDYIKFGVKKKYSKRSGPSKRTPWWKLPKQATECSEILFPRNYNDKIAVYYNPNKFIANRFYRFETDNHEKFIKLLNSTLNIFMMELFGRKNLGLGALDLEIPELQEIPILDIEKINGNFGNLFNREIRSIFEEIGINPNKPIREQEPKPLPDRAKLDEIIFSALELTMEERKEVYWATCELVHQRLTKAKSLK